MTNLFGTPTSTAPKTVPGGLPLYAEEPQQVSGHPREGAPTAPASMVFKVALGACTPVAIVVAWQFGGWSARLLDLGVTVTLAGLWATKPVHLTFLRWTRVMVGRLLLGVGGLLLALGVFAQWMLPALVHEVQHQVDRTVSTTVDKAKSGTVDDLKDRLPDWLK